MRPTLDAKLAMDALNVSLIVAHRLPLHFDQGATDATGSCREIVRRHSIRQRMSRKRDYWDDAPMKSSFHTPKTESVMHCDHKTRDDARVSLFECMDVPCNRQQRHSSIGCEAPQPFEAMESTG